MQSTSTITVVGCHAEGEVGRVITGGVPTPPGDSLFEQREYLRTRADELRKFLLYEPRGGAFVHANLIVPATTPGADAGFIIMEATDYPAMSGSNSICVATVLLETGMVAMVEPETRLRLDTPGGPIEVLAQCRDGRCLNVRTRNVPSFVTALDAAVEVPGLGTVTADIAYGGAFFAIVDAPALGFALTADEARELVELGERIKAAAAAQHLMAHPENPGIRDITFTQFAAPVVTDEQGRKVGRNTVVISPGKLDRSPCGTGSSARLAVLHARGQIGEGEAFLSRSVIDTEFQCEIVETCRVGDLPAVSPTLRGRAWITGSHHYTFDPDDPFPQGYTLSDTWYRALD
ncbi:MAG: proline racemase family protein [Alphaproteobacteria bacterium]|jgi:proline racemase|nr:proline racemase family protein [Alphaproteobacteria bacterium]MDP6564846.1 proline racemase family protein [Alphaproteobacteria bacterium]MDP6812442.1 proline racemase family protein [Alphaproteobacteria bacterium]